jgi:hypothetical protein
MPVRRSKSRKSVRRSKSRKSVRRSKRKSVRRSRIRKSRKSIKPVNCKVARSRTNKKSDLIKEVRSYVRCHERKTQVNHDLSMSRLKTESVAKLKKRLSLYRNYNKK